VLARLRKSSSQIRSTAFERIPGSGSTPRGITPTTPERREWAEKRMRIPRGGDCPTNGNVVPNLKIRTKRLVHDGHKLQSPWGRSPEQCVQGRWRAVATAFLTQSPSPSASDLPDAGLLHPYEPAPATFDGNLRPRACAWHRIPYGSRCSVALAHDQGCPRDF